MNEEMSLLIPIMRHWSTSEKRGSLFSMNERAHCMGIGWNMKKMKLMRKFLK